MPFSVKVPFFSCFLPEEVLIHHNQIFYQSISFLFNKLTLGDFENLTSSASPQ